MSAPQPQSAPTASVQAPQRPLEQASHSRSKLSMLNVLEAGFVLAVVAVGIVLAGLVALRGPGAVNATIPTLPGARKAMALLDCGPDHWYGRVRKGGEHADDAHDHEEMEHWELDEGQAQRRPAAAARPWMPDDEAAAAEGEGEAGAGGGGGGGGRRSEGLARFPGLFGGVLDDWQRRSRFCGADYAQGLRHSSKTLSAALFMMFATLFSTVALGSLVEKATNKRIGLSEYLLANCLAGMAHALFGAQPLLVLRPTGPITAITIKLSELADYLGLDFFDYLCATGVCISLLMAACAATELSRHIVRLTPFTHEIFACFVCSIYVVDGTSEILAHASGAASVDDFGLWLFSANLALITFGVAAFLHTAHGWRVLPEQLRTLLVDYDVTIAVLFCTAVSFSWGVVASKVERIELPAEISPTCHWDPLVSEKIAEHGLAAHATAGFALGRPPTASCVGLAGAVAGDHRPWMPAFDGDSPLKLWLAALLSAVPITFFFYMDQNISSLLCQLPEYNLKHGHYFNLSFLWMGIFNAVGPAFGLPFVTGSLPHSPQFVRALTVAPRPGENKRPFVVENRVAPLLMYAMLGLPLLFPQLLALIPRAAIQGVLVYVGAEGILATTLWQRTLLLASPPSSFPQRLLPLGLWRVHSFTLLQLALLGACWWINLSPLGLCVAFLIVALVPFRLKALPKMFSAAELAALDSEGTPD